jgi:hypothetical protein
MNDLCLAGNPARNGVCGEEGCVCDAVPAPWFATDDRARDLPAHMQRWEDEARGD